MNACLTLRTALEAAGGDPSGWHIPKWTVESDASVNEQFGISTAILSLTAPGACILKDSNESAALARSSNEFSAKVRDEFPTRYGFFAALPDLVNSENALAEIAYAFDVLKADGVTLFTRYGDGNQYLGHPDFKEIWTELNRRQAVVFVHPTHPVETEQISGIPQPVLRYTFETTTAAVDMLVNRTVRNNPNCKIILSHAGGALPYLVGRPASMLTNSDEELQSFMEDAKSFYLDTALSGSDEVLRLLESFAKPGHILYGSDTPYASEKMIRFHTSRQDKYQFENPGMAENVKRRNALELFPRFK